MPIVLASTSQTRRALLEAAGIEATVVPPRVDEEAIRDAMCADGASPRDIAGSLADAKARKVAQRRPGDLVLGCDQVLDHGGRLMSKPATAEAAEAQLRALSGDRHALVSAIVAYEGSVPVWRHVGVAQLTMRTLSETYVAGYVARNWEVIRHSVGSYTLEGEGMRLFVAVEGQYFDVLGMPMIPLLSWLIDRGYLEA